jgi:hypothetical protein
MSKTTAVTIKKKKPSANATRASIGLIRPIHIYTPTTMVATIHITPNVLSIFSASRLNLYPRIGFTAHPPPPISILNCRFVFLPSSIVPCNRLGESYRRGLLNYTCRCNETRHRGPHSLIQPDRKSRPKRQAATLPRTLRPLLAGGSRDSHSRLRVFVVSAGRA